MTAVPEAIPKQRTLRASVARLAERYYGFAVSTFAVLSFIVFWEMAAMRGWADIALISSPSAIWRATVDVAREDDFALHAWTSFSAFGWGFLMALAVGIGLGLLLGTSRRVRLFVEPPLMALYTAPRLALLPILIVWLGIGLGSKIAVVFLGAVFPILINTMAGVRSADPRLITVAHAFGASRPDVFLKILIPGSLPAILIGVRLGIGRGVLSVVVGEMFVSEAGIGHQIMTYGEAMQFDRLLVYAFAISIFGYALTIAVRWFESIVENWRPAA